MSDEMKRKFHNPTDGYVGCVQLDEDRKPKGMPVAPKGDVWLSEAEERLTAEAPRFAANNPFTKEWREVTEIDAEGKPKVWVDRKGVLVLSDEPARTILSDRFTPSGAKAEADAAPDAPEEEPVEEQDAGAGQEQEHTGAPPLPRQPPVEGKPSPDEHVGTPSAVQANDEHLARKAAAEAQAMAEEEAEASEGEPDTTVEEGEKPLRTAQEIGIRKEPTEAALV